VEGHDDDDDAAKYAKDNLDVIGRLDGNANDDRNCIVDFRCVVKTDMRLHISKCQ
jgi:hypothetical protein